MSLSSPAARLLASFPAMEEPEWNVLAKQNQILQHLYNHDKEQVLQDHAIQTCSSSSKDTTPKVSTDLSKALTSRLQDHQQSLYLSKTQKSLQAQCTVCDVDATESSSSDNNNTYGSQMIHTFVQVLDLKNQSTGYWAGQWTVQRLTETEATLEGTVTIHCFNQEQSSTHWQMKQHFDVMTVSTVEEKVNAIVAKLEQSQLSYDEKLAQKLVTTITRKEDDVYQQIDSEVYEGLDTQLKQLRRILPVTKTRFKWDAAAQKQVVLLNARKTTAEI